MKEIIKILSKITFEIDSISELSNSAINNKDLIDKLLNITTQSIHLISIIDKDTIEEWKIIDKYAFLHFVPGLKNILLIIDNYLESVSPSLKHFYTNEISEEIDSLHQKIKKTENDLNNNSQDNLIKEKETLENNYHQLQNLLKEKDELNRINTILKNFNFEELNKQIIILEAEVSEIQEKLLPLTTDKENLESAIKHFNQLDKEVNILISNEQQSFIALIEKIELAVEIIKDKHKNWNVEKLKLIEKMEQEAKYLMETETEIKNYLSGLSVYRYSYIKNKEILDKHFSSNKKILSSLPNIKNSIEEKIEQIEQDLLSLDTEIAAFLELNQKITDEITKHPLTFDY